MKIDVTTAKDNPTTADAPARLDTKDRIEPAKLSSRKSCEDAIQSGLQPRHPERHRGIPLRLMPPDDLF